MQIYIAAVYSFVLCMCIYIQGGSYMTGTDLYKHTHKSVLVIFEPPCIIHIVQ